MVVKPSFNHVEIKTEPLDRSSPGPMKTTGRKATSSIKVETINGYGSPQNATDETEGPGLKGGAGGGKRKPRATAASKERDKRAKTAAAAASAAVSATPASSTGGSSSEGDASESENDVNNGGGGGGRTKKGGGAVASLKESAGKSSGAGRGSLANRQRNSDSSSSSKEGQPVRKGRAAGGASGLTATGNTAASSGSNAKPAPINPFNKPPVAVLKKSGDSFLQVQIRISFVFIPSPLLDWRAFDGLSSRLTIRPFLICRFVFVDFLAIFRMLHVGRLRRVWPSAANVDSLLTSVVGTRSKATPTSFAVSTLSVDCATPKRAN